tara:strand:+ start:59 stop:991 length:933 start_codon:yes stop_codon:yes gene_type:complete
MGKILGGGGGSKAKPAQPYAGAQFQPYSYTNQVGSTTGTKEGAYGFNVASQIDPSLTSLGQTALGYTQPYLESYLGQTTRQLPMFGGVDSGEQRAADIFGQQSALLQPKFAQQRQQLSNDLFGSGRLGLMLSGQTAGAGDVGMVNPDAYGLGLAQSRALAELGSQARTQAQQEQQQMFTQALQGFAVNEQQAQQQAANYLGGFQGALGAFGTVAELEQALVNQGLNIEQARSAAQASSANSGAALANAGTKATSGGGGLFSSLLGSAASAFGSPLGTAAASYLFPGTGQAANSLGLTGQSSYADWLAKVT